MSAMSMRTSVVNPIGAWCKTYISIIVPSITCCTGLVAHDVYLTTGLLALAFSSLYAKRSAGAKESSKTPTQSYLRSTRNRAAAQQPSPSYLLAAVQEPVAIIIII